MFLNLNHCIPRTASYLLLNLRLALSFILNDRLTFLLNHLSLPRPAPLLRRALAVLINRSLALPRRTRSLWRAAVRDLLLGRRIDWVASLDGFEFGLELALEGVDLLAEAVGVAAGGLGCVLCWGLVCGSMEWWGWAYGVFELDVGVLHYVEQADELCGVSGVLGKYGA